MLVMGGCASCHEQSFIAEQQALLVYANAPISHVIQDQVDGKRILEASKDSFLYLSTSTALMTTYVHLP